MKKNQKDGTVIGNCGKCQNGQVVADTSKYNTSCQTCTAENAWMKKNKENGTNKQSNGQCCVNGTLNYHDSYCPDDPQELTYTCQKSHYGSDGSSSCTFIIPSEYKHNYTVYATGSIEVNGYPRKCWTNWAQVTVNNKTLSGYQKVGCGLQKITFNQTNLGT